MCICLFGVILVLVEGRYRSQDTSYKILESRCPYWWSEDKTQARLRLAAVFALTLGTTGISVGFNFLGRDFYNALAGMS
jgi:ABC-type uncharacterized transport system fused permease/ATPase subunit